MDQLSASIEQHARDVLPTVTRVFIFVYLVIGCSHFLLLPDELTLPMSLLAFATFGYGVLIRYNLHRKVVETHSEHVLLSFVLLAAVNTLVHLFLTGELKHTTNLIFVLAVGGYLMPRNQIFYPVLVVVLLSWASIVATGQTDGDDLAHFGFEVLLGCLFSVFLQMLRRNQLEQMGDLEQSVDQLNQSQQRVSASESLLQSLMDNIPAGILVRSPKSRKFLFVNDVARELLNFHGVVGQSEVDVDLFDRQGNVLSQLDAPISRLDRGEIVENEVMGLRRADGSIVWGLVNAFLLDIQQTGEEVMVLAFVDITEQIRAEIDLNQSETRAFTILDSIIEGVIAVDGSEVITLFNPGASDITGVSEEQAVGENLASVLSFESDGDGTDPGAIQTGSITRPDGSKVQVELLVSDIQESPENNGWVYTIRDVSEQLRLEQERATMDKMTSIGILAGGIAHDFNNLLTAIYGNLALAESSMDAPGKAVDFLKRSSESIQLATNLTKQLLTFSTGSDPVRDVVDIEKLVREAVRFSLSGSSVVATYEIDPQLKAVEVDAGQVQQAIGNIVLNAKQAMDDVGQITISMVNISDDFVEVQVRDEGPGIPADRLGKVFDPYFTTKSTGTGLGLATTHSVVTKHGGSISVESSEGGTVFRMTFPATTSPVKNDEQVVVLDSADERLEVLVMDDEEIVLNTICQLLAHLGHKPTATRDGTEAISAYASKKQGGKAFDLAIMDLTVAGGMGGTVAASQILEIDPNAKLIVSSGYSSGAEMARFRELGFCARLEKPFRATDLEKTIHEVMK